MALEPITATDVPAVAEFLHRHLNTRVPARAWSAAMSPSWGDCGPNHGFLLRDRDRKQGKHTCGGNCASCHGGCSCK